MNYKRFCKRDLHFGKCCEEELIEKIREKWGNDIKKTKNKYAVFDFENKDLQIELKNRRCSSKTYPSMMIGLNKIIKAQQDIDKKKSIFLWNLTDGLFMWEYNDEDYYVSMGGRTNRGKDERKQTAFIPMDCLTLV